MGFSRQEYWTKLCLDSSLIKHPKPKLLCPVNSSKFIVLCLNNIQEVCFGHFLGPASLRPPGKGLKLVSFSSVNLSCVSFFLLVQLQELKKERGENFPLLDSRITAAWLFS